jgi:hypothetical protein
MMKLETLLSLALCLVLIFFSSFASDEKLKKSYNRGGASAFHTVTYDDDSNVMQGVVESNAGIVSLGRDGGDDVPTGTQYTDPTSLIGEYLAFIPPILNYSGSTCIPSSSEFTIYNTLKDRKITVTRVTSDNIQFNPVFFAPISLNAEEHITITVIFLPYYPDDKIIGTLRVEASVDSIHEDTENESLLVEYSIVGSAKVNPYRIYPLLGHQTYIGATYEQSISIFNAFGDLLQIREIFTTELFMSLKNILGHEHTTTSLQPGAYKEIIMLSLAANEGGNNTGYVHIKTNHDDIVIPVSIFVVDSGLVPLPAAVNFGTLIAVNEQKTVTVLLMNKGAETLYVHNIMTQYDDPNMHVTSNSQRVLHPVDVKSVDSHSYITIDITYTASKAEKIKNTLLITTNHSNPILAVKEIDIEGAVLLGGIGYDQEKIIFPLPITNVTCNRGAKRGAIQRNLGLINYFQDPIAVNIVELSACNSIITTTVDRADLRNQVVGSTDKLQSIPLTFHQDLAVNHFSVYPDALPYTCWLELWTNISSHRIPLHIISGALSLAFTDAAMYDENEVEAAGLVDSSDDDLYKLDKLRRDTTAKYCHDSSDGELTLDGYITNGDIYDIDMGMVSIADPRPLRLAYVNNNPINLDLALLNTDTDLCICFEASWPEGMSDDDVAISRMTNIADRTYQQAMNDKQKCSCNRDSSRGGNETSAFHCKVGYISLFTALFDISEDTLLASSYITSFVLGSLYQHIHVFVRMQLQHLDLLSSVRLTDPVLSVSGHSSIVVTQLYEGPPLETADIITKVYLSNASAVYSSMNRVENPSIFSTYVSRSNDSSWETTIDLGSSNLFASIRHLITLYMTEHGIGMSGDDSSAPLVQLLNQLASASSNVRNLEQLGGIRSALATHFPLGIPLKAVVLLTYTPYSLHHKLIENITVKLPFPATISHLNLPSVHSSSVRSENIVRKNDYFLFFIQLSNPFMHPITASIALNPEICFSNGTAELVPNHVEILHALLSDAFPFIDRASYEGTEYTVSDEAISRVVTSLKGCHLLKTDAELDVSTTGSKAFVISQDTLKPCVLAPGGSKYVGPILFAPSAISVEGSIVRHNLGLTITNNFTGEEHVHMSALSAAVNFSVHSVSSFKYSHNVNNKKYVVEPGSSEVAQVTVNITTFDDTLFTLHLANYGATAVNINKIVINNSTLHYGVGDKEKSNSFEEMPVYVPVGGTKAITLELSQSDVCLFTGKIASLELVLDSGDIVRVQIRTRIIKSLLHACQHRNISYNNITLEDIIVIVVIIAWIGFETKCNAASILHTEMLHSSTRGSTSSTVSSIATLFKASKKKFPVNTSGKRVKTTSKKSVTDPSGMKSKKSSDGSEDLQYLLSSNDHNAISDITLKAVNRLLESRNAASVSTSAESSHETVQQVADLLDESNGKDNVLLPPEIQDSAADADSFKAYNPFGDRSLLEVYPHSSFAEFDPMYEDQSLSSPMDSFNFTSLNIMSPTPTAATDFSWFSHSSGGQQELNEDDRLFSDINMVINNDYMDTDSNEVPFYYGDVDQIADRPPGFPHSPPQRRKVSFDVAGYLAGLGNSPNTRGSIPAEKKE